MKIHEYQAKQVFARYQIPIPEGHVVFSPEEAERFALALQSAKEAEHGIVVKAQIHAGGRGKGGGVKVIRGGSHEVKECAAKMLGMQLITHQTGPSGQMVRRLYIEQGLQIERELYLGIVLDRDSHCIALIVSAEGGVEIEKMAEETPDKIQVLHINPLVGFCTYQARQLAFSLKLNQHGKQTVGQFIHLVTQLFQLMVKEDCVLVEINPLVVTRAGSIVALDAKVNTDDNAECRHPEWKEWRDIHEEDPLELEAKNVGLNYVSLNGNVGCLVNGAGLAMATMDIIKYVGASKGVSPANFLDVGGGANQGQVAAAFKMILASPEVKAIFVNIFGGIMKCDVIARGIVAAAQEVGVKVPLVVRLEGTNVELGRQVLAESGFSVLPATTMADGAEKIVKAVCGEVR
ncbi:ADP-forming succinate--CoA ligase subunit beta [Pajaroellobacter abortibovis]|uniref:Succinate--CoA ligase [ADP-forming] subunit beta n=1 Tax=Pajaroellobacter abortibovis TaxID=1882918 RepID=A0A1L6MXH5_9BACT|nr:ADP-forming succinate--CoA ligase subunit beta [Pajaroellobacter abortibovis]APS00283.1 succinate--CoA ligase subunit beta [Pajaroellobacter abortibovis]